MNNTAAAPTEMPAMVPAARVGSATGVGVADALEEGTAEGLLEVVGGSVRVGELVGDGGAEVIVLKFEVESLVVASAVEDLESEEEEEDDEVEVGESSSSPDMESVLSVEAEGLRVVDVSLSLSVVVVSSLSLLDFDRDDEVVCDSEEEEVDREEL